MSKKTKVVIIFSSIALACMIGAGIIVGIFFGSNNDFAKFSNIFEGGQKIDESEQLSLKGVSALAIDCVSGRIDIVEADTAKVELTGDVWGNQQKKESYLDVYEKDGTIFIKYDIDSRPFSFLNIDVKMTVYLPRNNMLNLDIISTSGDINIQNMQFSDVKIKSTSGYTLIKECAGASLSLEKTSGDTDIAAADFNSISIVSQSGNIDIGETFGAVAIRSTSGDTRIENAYGPLAINSTSGDVAAQITGKTPSVDIGVTSGDVQLLLNKNAAFDLSVKATSGRVNTDFDITINGNNSNIVEKSITGECNGGGDNVNITTLSGNISVMKD